MPFVKINVAEEIQKLRESDPEFKKAWDSSREEYKRIGEEIAKEKGKYKSMTWDELERELFTPEEITRNHRRAHKMYNREMRRQRKRRRERKEINKRLK